jgi:hypothetical protein
MFASRVGRRGRRSRRKVGRTTDGGVWWENRPVLGITTSCAGPIAARARRLFVGALLLALTAACIVVLPAAVAAPARQAREHFACSGPNSAHVPCHFSTPSGNVRCLWTPSPNRVSCELLANGRSYRLGPRGRARSIRLRLARRGQTLPTNQQLTLPNSLSCHDTARTMTCNQDFGNGAFHLQRGASHAS